MRLSSNSPRYRDRLLKLQKKLYSNPPEFQTGQVVDILYDPQDPGRARVKKWSTLYFTPLLLAGIGIIFGCIGMVLLIFKLIDLIHLNWHGPLSNLKNKE